MRTGMLTGPHEAVPTTPMTSVGAPVTKGGGAMIWIYASSAPSAGTLTRAGRNYLRHWTTYFVGEVQRIVKRVTGARTANIASVVVTG